MYKHILLPTDGSPASAHAAHAGVELAAAIGARVTAFFAAPAPTPLIYDGVLPVGYMSPDQRAEMIGRTASRYLDAIAQAAKAAGVPCEALHVTSDFPSDAILETAKRLKCDLIFMASHGSNGLSALLLGSVTQKVLAHSKIPVVVYR
jgi:nucleotide-binding universal stress UspA family protein